MSALSKLTGDLAGTYTKMEDIPPEKQEEMVKNHQLFHNKDQYVAILFYDFMTNHISLW